jgi:hypothetical protein
MTKFLQTGVGALRRLSSQWLPHPLFARSEPSSDEGYLAGAVDMGDLERRIRQIERGTVQHASTQLSLLNGRH